MRCAALLALAIAAGLAGCIQCNVTVSQDRSSSRSATHQDTARVTSSTQDASVAAEAPLSLLPK